MSRRGPFRSRHGPGRSPPPAGGPRRGRRDAGGPSPAPRPEPTGCRRFLPRRSTRPQTEGGPARSASSRRVWFSAATAPAASSHEVPWSDEARHDHVEQQRRLGRRGRDEGQEAGAVAGDDRGRQMLGEQTQARSAGSCGSEPRAPASGLVEHGLLARKIQGDGVERQPPPAVIEDQGRQPVIGNEHRVAHRLSLPHPDVSPARPAAAPEAGPAQGPARLPAPSGPVLGGGPQIVDPARIEVGDAAVVADARPTRPGGCGV